MLTTTKIDMGRWWRQPGPAEQGQSRHQARPDALLPAVVDADCRHEVTAKFVWLDQSCVGAGGANGPVVHDDDGVGVDHGGQSVRDHDHGRAAPSPVIWQAFRIVKLGRKVLSAVARLTERGGGELTRAGARSCSREAARCARRC